MQVRENEAGEIAIHYRNQRLVFRELKAASTALGEGMGAAPSLRSHPQSYVATFLQLRIIPGEKAFPQRHALSIPGQRETKN